jgi:hypothetical protein
MKKLIIVGLLLLQAVLAEAQTFPVNNLTVSGTATFSLRPLFNGNTPYDTGNLPSALSGYALLNSPSFVGVPTVPAPAVGTNTTQIATTAFDAAGKACASIMDFGGDPTNTNSNNTAFTNAIAASQNPSGRACVAFPPGKFKFTAAASYTLPTSGASITIVGSGADVTELTFPNATNGIAINGSSPGNSFHIRGMTVSTGQTGSVNGIIVIQSSSLNDFAQSDIHDVTLRGADNNAGAGGSDYWGTAILVEGWCGVSYDSLTIYGSGSLSTAVGTGILIEGNGTGYSIYHNISKSTLNALAVGITYGSYAQGITVTQSNFQNDNTGFSVPASESGVLSQLQISDSQFANYGNEIAILTAVGNVFIHDNDIFVHTNVSGIDIATSQGFTITGNQISTDGSANTGTNGIAIGPGVNTSQMGTIVGNTIAGLVVGVLLESSSSYNNVNSNNYNVSTPVDNLGGSACPPSTSGNCVGTATK